jgi:hypothetical protein
VGGENDADGKDGAAPRKFKNSGEAVAHQLSAATPRQKCTSGGTVPGSVSPPRRPGASLCTLVEIFMSQSVTRRRRRLICNRAC